LLLPDHTPNQLLNVSYDPTREVYAALDKSFVEQYREQTGVELDVKQSHGGSGRQARSVIDGSEKANVVSLALISDVDQLRKRGLIAADWQKRLPNGSDGVAVATPDPRTSGNGQLSFLALSILLFVPRAAKLKAAELTVSQEGVVRERLAGDPDAESTIIYDLQGEFFFGAAPELDRYLDTLRARIRSEELRFVILRLKRVRDPDAVCIERLERFLHEENGHGVNILLAGFRPDTLKVLRNLGFEHWFPVEQVFPEEDEEF
jgi:hypothetical protein